MPVIVVTETWIKWITNDVLYEAAFTFPVFHGLLRGVFGQVVPPGEASFGLDQQLSAFAQLLGFVEETQPYAAAAASPEIADVLWAVTATALGTSRLRQTSPVLARAFRIAGLMAATAPLFTMIYFLVFGGDGVSGWYSVFGSLLGQLDDGTWLPMWIRVIGAGIFFLLPPLIAAWQLRSDELALGVAACSTGRPRAVDRPAPMSWGAALVGAIVVLALALWASRLALGQPYPWSMQTLWLVLWLGWLEWIHRGLGGSAPGRASWRWVPLAAVGLLALAIANLVVQVGVQWAVASACLAAAPLDVEFFGWFLGQVKTPPAVTLPPAAVGTALVGNAAWAGALLWIGSRTGAALGRVLRLAALQAATTPLILAQYLILSILTKVERHRISGHLPAVDLWGVWSYVMGRPLEGSLPRYQAMPEWISLCALILALVAMPLGFFALRLRIERREGA
ncbi:MAG: hypothetical protein ACREKH_21745 [Candidatus Rokuibacteriota bacterium]